MKLILGALLSASVLSCGGFKEYKAPDPIYSKYYVKYRYGKCEEWKIEDAKECVLDESKPSAECSLYLMRCTKLEWNQRCRRGCEW
jgi:hypothetical protein